MKEELPPTQPELSLVELQSIQEFCVANPDKGSQILAQIAAWKNEQTAAATPTHRTASGSDLSSVEAVKSSLEFPEVLEKDEFFQEVWRTVQEDAKESKEAGGFIEAMHTFMQQLNSLPSDATDAKAMEELARGMGRLSRAACAYIDSPTFTLKNHKYNISSGTEKRSVSDGSLLKSAYLPDTFQKIFDAAKHTADLKIKAPLIGDRFLMISMVTDSENKSRMIVSNVHSWAVLSKEGQVFSHAEVETE